MLLSVRVLLKCTFLVPFPQCMAEEDVRQGGWSSEKLSDIAIKTQAAGPPKAHLLAPVPAYF